MKPLYWIKKGTTGYNESKAQPWTATTDEPVIQDWTSSTLGKRHCQLCNGEVVTVETGKGNLMPE